MATSRCRGDPPLTTWPPKRNVPDVIVSSPATIRSAVVFPHPDGPTSTTNSPGPTCRSRPSTPRTPVANTLVRPSIETADTRTLRTTTNHDEPRTTTTSHQEPRTPKTRTTGNSTG